jgi:hypothetical protein
MLDRSSGKLVIVKRDEGNEEDENSSDDLELSSEERLDQDV